MNGEQYVLQDGEILLLDRIEAEREGTTKSTKVKLTNLAIIVEEYGLFNKLKKIDILPHQSIVSVSIKESEGNDAELVINYFNHSEVFKLSNNKLNTLIWEMALEDCKSNCQPYLDFSYYSNFYKNIKKHKDEYDRAHTDMSDLKDQLIIMGNSLREGFGGKIKKTNNQIREKKFCESFEREKSLARKNLVAKLNIDMKNKAEEKQRELDKKRKAEESRKSEEAKKNAARENYNNLKMTFDEQVAAVNRLMDLVGAGLLTQEEFEIKKKEIMNLY